MGGALPPVGFFDPAGFAANADERTLKKYRGRSDARPRGHARRHWFLRWRGRGGQLVPVRRADHRGGSVGHFLRSARTAAGRLLPRRHRLRSARPDDQEELDIMITKELQHGRLAMLAAAGFLAQEAVDGKGILEHLNL